METPQATKRDLFDWVQTGSQVYGAAKLGQIAGYLERQEYAAALHEQQQQFEKNREHSDRIFKKAVKNDFPDSLYGLLELASVGLRLNRDRYISPKARAHCNEFLRLRMDKITEFLPEEVKKDLLWFSRWTKNTVLRRVNDYCAETAGMRDVPAKPGVAIPCGISALVLLGAASFMEGKPCFVTIAVGFLLFLVALATSARRVFVPELVFDESWDHQFQLLGELGVLSEEQVRTRSLGDLEAFKARMADKQAEVDASPIGRMYLADKAEYHELWVEPVTPEACGVAEAREEFEQRYKFGGLIGKLQPIPDSEIVTV